MFTFTDNSKIKLNYFYLIKNFAGVVLKMKTLLKILSGIVIVLLIAIITLPFIFKDQIKEVVKNATNNSVNAKVDFSDVDLSLLSSFPNLSVSVDDLSIVNYAPFEGDTIFSTKSINISVDIMSVISGDELKIKSINFNSPKILMYVLENGMANYNITKEDTAGEKSNVSQDTVKSKFKINLQSYSITNGKIAFVDQSSNFLVAIDNLNHSGKGDFTQDEFVLDTETNIVALTFEMDGIKYFNSVKANLDMLIDINLKKMKFILKENKLSLNNLLVKFDGSIAMPSDNIDIDLTFSSPRSDFKDIISLIPAIYKNDFNDLKTSGKMKLSGMVKGLMTKDKFPTFNLDLKVSDGNFQYPDLPTPVNNVNANLQVSNKTGVLDNTVIDLKNIHVELGSDPIDGKMLLKNIDTGLNVDMKLKGNINLKNLKTALALKEIKKLEGTIKTDFEANGNIASTQNNYESINAKGYIELNKLIYQGTDVEQEIKVNNASLNFSPQNIKLNNLNIKLGESDISAKGSLNNLISYVLSDGILVGRLNINSEYFNFNPFLIPEESDKDTETNEENTTAFDIPKNVNFTMVSKFDKLIYDNLELQNVKGQISVKDSKVILENLNINLLDGSLTGSGYYAKNEYQEKPDIQFNLGLKDFNVKKTYDKFLSVKKFAPVAKYIDGSFSSNLKMKTTLDNTLTPVWETFFSNGSLNLKTAVIKNFKPFTKLASVLNLQELSNPKIQNVNPSFEIKNGRFYVNPVNFRVANYDVEFSGSNGIDQSLDYIMNIKIPAENLKGQINKSISSLIGKDLNLITSSSINVRALISGTVDSPNISTSAADVSRDVAADVVQQAKTQILDQAKAKADSIRAEAEKKLKEEAKKKEDELKKKLEDEAKKKLKNIFGFG